MIIIDILSYILYVIVSICTIRLVNIETKSFVNITSVFVLPYLIICTIQEIVCLTFDFFQLPNFEYWFINIVFVFVTGLVEFVMSSLSQKRIFINSFTEYYDKQHLSKLFIALAALAVIATGIDSFKMVNSIELGILLQDDFQDEFGESAGGNFYIRLLTLIMAVYFLGINKSKIGYMIGLLCFVPHIVVNTKGILFIPVIASLLTRIILGRITSFKKTFLILGILGVFIFFSSYLLENLIYKESVDFDRLIFLCEKLISYMLSGVQEFFVNIRDGIEHNVNKVNITLAPIENLFAKFGIGESVSNVNTEFYRSIGKLPHYGAVYSNVNGYIGTLYLFNGLIGGLLYHVFLIIIAFLIKIKTYACKRPFWIILYSLFLSGFFLGWFEFYFMHTFWVYFIVLTFIIDYFSRFLKY